MQKNRFEGWYFKHRTGAETIAFIPGRAKGGAFIQMIDNEGSRHFDVPSLRMENGAIYAGGCSFSKHGAIIELPGVRGEILYGPFTPLRSPIMGPFRYLPMECRHEVISMGHGLSGSLTIDGRKTAFDGGRGYIEKDIGVSFPSSYQWMQCNTFSKACSVMVSIARIPFAGLHFTGCICAILYAGREYRLATYKGVKILAAQPEHICLAQGNLLLEIHVRCSGSCHPLRSPVLGEMRGLIHEGNCAAARFNLWENGVSVFDLESGHVGYEYVKTNKPEGG
ncbi:MAG: tocopherol cyclase family protein [Candidatus Pelethousia sp.]|nr:tocopherol cyclase family protein [Candidatus Pelethousia sp.]